MSINGLKTCICTASHSGIRSAKARQLLKSLRAESQASSSHLVPSLKSSPSLSCLEASQVKSSHKVMSTLSSQVESSHKVMSSQVKSSHKFVKVNANPDPNPITSVKLYLNPTLTSQTLCLTLALNILNRNYA